MTRIVSAATIACDIAAVYDYVTTPGHWPEWHPSSLAVSGATDHSLQVGEQVTERFLVAGRRGEVVWTVRERAAPTRRVIEGTITTGAGGGGVVSYTLAPAGEATQPTPYTHFTREFTYPLPNLLYTLLDALVVRRRIAAESAEAVRRLTQRLGGQATQA